MNQTTLQPVKNRWALLVGINRYVDYPLLRYCVKDVQALEKLLSQLGYTVVSLHDQRVRDGRHFPTRNNIEAELFRLCETVEEDDLLLVHFACHGKLVGKVEGKQPVLVAQDSRDTTLLRTGLPLIEVEEIMKSSRAKRLVLLLDACHTGVEIGRGDLEDPEFIRNVYELAEGFAMIAGSTAQQITQESELMQQGVFTHFLLEGLSGKADLGSKGFVTVNDLSKYVLDRLRKWSVPSGARLQEPTAKVSGFGDIPLAYYRDLPLSTDAIDFVPILPQNAEIGARGATTTASNLRRKTLTERCSKLMNEYELANQQIDETIDEVTRKRLNSKAERLLREISEIDSKLEKIDFELGE